jgi:hypothetical protein
MCVVHLGWILKAMINQCLGCGWVSSQVVSQSGSQLMVYSKLDMSVMIQSERSVAKWSVFDDDRVEYNLLALVLT